MEGKEFSLLVFLTPREDDFVKGTFTPRRQDEKCVCVVMMMMIYPYTLDFAISGNSNYFLRKRKEWQERTEA